MVAAFEDRLLAAGRFRVLSRTELDAILAEHKLSVSGLIDPTLAVKVGKAASANYVVSQQLGMDVERSRFRIPGVPLETNIGRNKVNLNLQAQVMDTESTEIVHSQSLTKSIELRRVDLTPKPLRQIQASRSHTGRRSTGSLPR